VRDVTGGKRRREKTGQQQTIHHSDGGQSIHHSGGLVAPVASRCRARLVLRYNLQAIWLSLLPSLFYSNHPTTTATTTTTTTRNMLSRKV
jgi:hypothetical protein